jgi:hypothetical protein
MTPEETVPCCACGGTGRVSVSACPEIVHGRPCKNRVVFDPELVSVRPDLGDLLDYCRLHRNMRARDRSRSAEARDQ